MSTPTIAVDMDGVLVVAQPKILDAVNRRYGTDYRANKVQYFDYSQYMRPEEAAYALDYWHTGNLYYDLEPEPGALEGVEELRSLGDVIVVSSTLAGHATSKARWLGRYGFDRDLWFMGHDKTRVQWDVLVDDGAHNIRAAFDAGRIGVVFDRPWNRSLGWAPRVGDWSGVPVTISEILGRGLVPSQNGYKPGGCQ